MHRGALESAVPDYDFRRHVGRHLKAIGRRRTKTRPDRKDSLINCTGAAVEIFSSSMLVRHPVPAS